VVSWFSPTFFFETLNIIFLINIFCRKIQYSLSCLTLRSRNQFTHNTQQP